MQKQKKFLRTTCIEKWNTSLNDGVRSILRTYATFKETFEMKFLLKMLINFDIEMP